MIVGCGIDIVEIKRFIRAKDRWGDAFLKKIFTHDEIAYSAQRRFSGQHLAARFAAKEAVFKAFGDDKASIRTWADIEIVNDTNGKPGVMFHGSAEELKRRRKVTRVLVSMTHSRESAIANAILCDGEGDV